MRMIFCLLLVSVGCSAVGPAISETDEPVDDSEFGSGGLIETDQTGVQDGSGGVVTVDASGGAVGSGGAESTGGWVGGVGGSVVFGTGGALSSGGAFGSGGFGTGGAVGTGGSSFEDELLVELTFPVATASNSYAKVQPFDTQFSIYAHVVGRSDPEASVRLVFEDHAWRCGETEIRSGTFDGDLSLWTLEETIYETNLHLRGEDGRLVSLSGGSTGAYTTLSLADFDLTRWEAELTVNDCYVGPGNPLTVTWTRGLSVRLYGAALE